MSRWLKYDVPGDLPITMWKHELAGAWLDHLAGIVTRDPTSLSTDDRCSALLDLVTSVQNVYLALDLPPVADPIFVQARCSRYGWDVHDGVLKGQWVSDAQSRNFTDTSCVVDLSQRGDFDARVELRPDGALDVTHMRTAFGDGHSPCLDWDRWDYWRDTCPGGNPPIRGTARVPLLYVWELFRDVGSSLVSRGIDEIYRSSRAYITRENVRIAREQGLTDPDGLIGLAAARFEAARSPSDELAAVQTTLRTTAVTAATAGGPVGWFVAVLAGLAYGVTELFSHFGAVGRMLDCFGREYPLFEPARLTGQLAPEREPTQDVPEVPATWTAAPPPGWFPVGPIVGAVARVPVPGVTAPTVRSCAGTSGRAKKACKRAQRRERKALRLWNRTH